MLRKGRGMRRILALLALTVLTPAAQATAISVSAGETVLFSFDFTNGEHHVLPPYPDMRVETGVLLESFHPGVDSCRYTFFGDVNGGAQGSSVGNCDIDEFESALEESGWLDGLLSISLTVTSGEIMVDPRAVAYSAFGVDGRPITPRMVPSVRFVPEPEALWTVLLGCSLLIVQHQRRRRA